MIRITVKFIVVGLVFALAVLPGCGGRDEDAGRDEAAVEGGASTADATEIGTTEGKFPPPIDLPDLAGNNVTLADFEGKVVVLDLWATWCPPCRQEIPFLVELYDDLKDDGLVVVGVGLDEGGAGVLKPYAEANGVTYPILVGHRGVQDAYGVTGIPTTFFIGRNGRIASKHVGYHPSMAEGMRAEIMNLLQPAGEEA